MSARVERVTRLAAEAAAAAQVRELTTHPDVVALRVERVRAQVDALLWAGIVLGLAFTMVNVQSFAAAGAPPWSAAWLVAWLLDPMVSLVLLAVLRAEQVTARYQVALPPWARRTKWLTFAATYVMNTWTSWGLDGGPLSWSGVVLHSVPPLVVFATAETGPGLRDRLTEAVHRALTEHQASRGPDPAPAVVADAVPDGPTEVVDELDEPGTDVAAGDPGTDPAGADPDDGDPVEEDRTEADVIVADAVAAGVVDERGLSRLWETAPPALPVEGPQTRKQRAAALIAEGAGRRRLARELGISEYEARQLLDRTRTTPARPGGQDAEPADVERLDDEALERLGEVLEREHGQQDVDPERVHALNGAGINGAGYEIGGRS